MRSERLRPACSPGPDSRAVLGLAAGCTLFITLLLACGSGPSRDAAEEIQPWSRPLPVDNPRECGLSRSSPLALRDDALYFLWWDAALVSLDAATGAERFRFRPRHACGQQMELGERFVALVVSRVSWDRRRRYALVAVDPTTGRSAGFEAGLPGYPLEGSLAASAGRALVVTSRDWQPNEILHSSPPGRYLADPTLHAVDLASGEDLWSRPLQSITERYAPIQQVWTLAAPGGVAVVKAYRDARDGQRSWDAQGFDPESGEELWSLPVQPLERSGARAAALAGGRILFVHSAGAEIRDLASGALRKRYPRSADLELVSGAPGRNLVISDSVIYAYNQTRDLAAAFDLERSRLLWKRRTAEKRNLKGLTCPTFDLGLADGRLGFGAEDGSLYLLDAASGGVEGRFERDCVFGGGPAPVPLRNLLIFSDSSGVRAVRPVPGLLDWLDGR